MTAFIEFIRALFTASRLLMVAIVFLGVALLLVLWKMTSP